MEQPVNITYFLLMIMGPSIFGGSFIMGCCFLMWIGEALEERRKERQWQQYKRERAARLAQERPRSYLPPQRSGDCSQRTLH
ncbi:MAG: hypothetical protein AAB367_02385 [Patescibacteria group bacterium]